MNTFKNFRLKLKKYLEGCIQQFFSSIYIYVVVLGFITRALNKKTLFRADVFVETRAVKDYNLFINQLPFVKDTIELIRVIIAEEEFHIENWKNALDASKKEQVASRLDNSLVLSKI
jgi:hypothetical protein